MSGHRRPIMTPSVVARRVSIPVSLSETHPGFAAETWTRKASARELPPYSRTCPSWRRGDEWEGEHSVAWTIRYVWRTKRIEWYGIDDQTAFHGQRWPPTLKGTPCHAYP